jgi:hypothetical protein
MPHLPGPFFVDVGVISSAVSAYDFLQVPVLGQRSHYHRRFCLPLPVLSKSVSHASLQFPLVHFHRCFQITPVGASQVPLNVLPVHVYCALTQPARDF